MKILFVHHREHYVLSLEKAERRAQHSEITVVIVRTTRNTVSVHNAEIPYLKTGGAYSYHSL